MNEPRKNSSRAPRKTTISGEHPAVVGMRAKLKSLEENELERLSNLDEELATYLAEIRTPVPPPLDASLSEDDVNQTDAVASNDDVDRSDETFDREGEFQITLDESIKRRGPLEHRGPLSGGGHAERIRLFDEDSGSSNAPGAPGAVEGIHRRKE